MRLAPTRAWLGGLLLVVGGCAASPVGQLRFANRPPVWRVDDRRPIPRPAAGDYAKLLYFGDAYVLRRLPRALEFRGRRRALGVNALDEAPDSSWFTNRIGQREMSVEQVRRGPTRGEGPEAYRPWIVLGTKVGGASVGFIIRDRRGEKYLLKFDEKQNPEMETAADVIVQRILHACGYNVPEDNIVYFRRSDLLLDRDAMVKDTLGHERSMTEKDLQSNLALVHVEPDGRIRGMTSRLLAGVPLGGIAMEGTRKDDPSDRIPHELRRDLRGLNAIFAWVNQTDVKEANSLDIWAPDPEHPARHHVVHYQLDFGMALGGTGYAGRSRQVGFAHAVDLKYTLLTLPTLGLWRRPWETIEQPHVPAVGLFSASGYRPDLFTPSFPYYPFYEADRFDNFWGAKILMRLTPAHLEAIVKEARYSDPRSTEYMIGVLIERQRITARHWFRQVSPLDRFELRTDAGETRLCFDDLMLVHGLEQTRDTTRYEATAYDFDGRPTGWRAEAGPGAAGHVCLGALTLPHRHEGYMIVHITTRRAGRSLPPVQVHLARDPTGGEARIIGLRRY